MAVHDITGREYARFGLLKLGDKVQVDGNFTCIPEDKILKIKNNKFGLFIPCSEGKHFLEGQLDQDTDYLIGIYPVEKTKP